MAILLALLSSVMWGTSDFFGGLRSRTRPAVAVVAGSMLAGLLTAWVAVLFVGAYDDPTGWVWWSVLSGVAGASGLVAFYAALASGTMGVVSPIAALGVAVPVIAGFIRGETPSTLQTVGLVIALVGAVATSGPELSGGASTRSVLLAAFAGLCFGTVFLAVDKGAKSSALMTLVGMRTTSLIMFGVAAVLLRSIGGLDRTDLLPLFVIGFFDVTANLMYALASNRGYVSIVSVLASLYPVMTVLLARAVLHERLRSVQLVGVVVTLTGVAFISAG
jgi:drug/metabolite transporter (DMT)-like permease